MSVDGPGAPRPLVVTLTGPECTGKTTLARALAARVDAAWSPEFARAYAARRGGALTARDVGAIARGQMAAEDAALHAAATSGSSLVVRDTDLVSTVVYARHYYGDAPAWLVAAARARRADLSLLCDVDLPWVADGVRDRPHDRAAMRDAFTATLEELGCRWLVLRGEGAAREEAATAVILRAAKDLGRPVVGTRDPSLRAG